MSKCGNNDCQWHKFCEGGLMWYDEDITECRDWVKPKPTKMKISKWLNLIMIRQLRY